MFVEERIDEGSEEGMEERLLENFATGFIEGSEKDGPKVLEVNSSPGLEGIEKASGKNVTARLYDTNEGLPVFTQLKPLICNDSYRYSSPHISYYRERWQR